MCIVNVPSPLSTQNFSIGRRGEVSAVVEAVPLAGGEGIGVATGGGEVDDGGDVHHVRD